MMLGGAASFGEEFSRLAGLMFIWSTIQQFIPYSARLYVDKFWSKLSAYLYPYVHITIPEYTRGVSNEAYSSVRTYLGANAKSCRLATNLTVDKAPDSKSLSISLDDGEEIVDEFRGALFKWKLRTDIQVGSSSSRRGMSAPQEKSSYTLVFHNRYRDLVTETYLETVIQQGKVLELRNRKRKLYSNKDTHDWYWNGGKWRHINFQHPANFNTLAMEPKKKQEIISDLNAFKKGKEYYSKIGKAWKRGYLLHGPPGTGKSTMIAAIANYMDYDIYDLELTSVENNAELKQLLIDTRNMSIIVIEDIDCSVDLTKKRKEESKKKRDDDDADDDDGEKEEEEEKEGDSKVTLSGLLNFIDGIWSACGQERIIIFTTNHVDKLDPALIRRGRMDLHIEMSYCKFEAFKILAKNYLDIDSHPLFEEIRQLLEENEVSPCDVAENLMPKSDPPNVESCLMTLIEAMRTAKGVKEELENKKETKTNKPRLGLLSRFSLFKKSAKKKS